jgi:hypothetical protein
MSKRMEEGYAFNETRADMKSASAYLFAAWKEPNEQDEKFGRSGFSVG